MKRNVQREGRAEKVCSWKEGSRKERRPRPHCVPAGSETEKIGGVLSRFLEPMNQETGNCKLQFMLFATTHFNTSYCQESQKWFLRVRIHLTLDTRRQPSLSAVSWEHININERMSPGIRTNARKLSEQSEVKRIRV